MFKQLLLFLLCWLWSALPLEADEPISVTLPGTITYTLQDTYGDGWNGASISVIDSNGNVVETITMSEGSSLEGSIFLNPDEDYKFVWKKGGYDNECGFDFYDENNKVILSHYVRSDFVYVDVEGYSTCLAKTDCAKNCSVSTITYNSAVLSWTGNEEVQSYNLRYRNTEADEDWHTVTGVTSPYTLTGLAAETNYAWEVQTVYSDHNSDWLMYECFTTSERYVRPYDFAVTDTAITSAVLSWSGNEDIQSYNLRYRKANEDEEWQTVKGVTSPYTLTGLAADTRYAWEVQAVYSDNSSKWAKGEAFTTLERYTRPYDLAVTNLSSTSAVLSWSGNEEVQSYNLRYREADFVLSENFENGMPSTWQTSGENVFVDTPPIGMRAPSGNSILGMNSGDYVILPQMPLGGALTFQAGAYESSTSGYYVKVIIDGDSVVVADRIVSAGSYAQQTVDLSAYTGQTGAISIVMTSGSYLIVDDVNILPADDAGWTTVNNAVAPYKLTGLTPETSYVVQAQAVYKDGKSKLETFPVITTLERYAKPYDLAVTDTTTSSAVLSWSGNEDVQSYNLRYREADVVLNENFENGMPSTWQKSGENVFVGPPPPGMTAPNGDYVLGISGGGNVTLPQMPLGGTLTFQAAAFDSSTAGYIIRVSTDEGDEIVAEGTANEGSFAIQTVDLSAYAGQADAISIIMTSGAYLIIDDVRISTGNVAEWTTVNNAVAPYTLKGLTLSTYYDVQVQAVYEEKTTDWTESVLFHTLESTIPAPTGLTIDNVTASGAVASWTGSDETQSYNLRYRAKDDSQAEWTVINGITAGTYTLTELEPETSYEVQVQATDGETISRWSSKKVFTTLERFAKPTGLTAESVKATNALLAWTGSADAQSYNLRYGMSNVILSENFDGSSISTELTSSGETFVGRPLSTSAPSGSNVMVLGENGDLAMPEIPLDGILTFKAAAEASSTASYEVYVSSVGLVASGTVEIGKFTQQTVDLSAYAGQTGTIIITKADGTYLLIDDIEVETDTEWQTVENIEDTHYAISGLEPETKYNVQVQTVFADGTSKWSDLVKFTTLERFAQPYDLKASSVTYNSAALSWKGNDDVQMYLMRYRENNMPLNENFDSSNEQLAGWEVNGSSFIENKENAPSGTGVLVITDGSVMKTNEIPLGGTLSFKTRGSFASYAVSVELGGEQKMLVSDFAPSGTFEEKTIDLSAYAGQTGRLIFSCSNNLKKVIAAKATKAISATDAPFLVINPRVYFDDIVLKLGDDAVVGDWISVDDVTSPYALGDLDPEKTYEVQVKAVYDEQETDWTKGVFFTTLLATGITDSHLATPAKNVDAWYDLSGRKLNARPAKAGMYIYRGKKIMVER